MRTVADGQRSRHTFRTNDQTSSFGCPSVDSLDNVNELYISKTLRQSHRRVTQVSMLLTSCLLSIAQLILLLLPVPKSTMICLLPVGPTCVDQLAARKINQEEGNER